MLAMSKTKQKSNAKKYLGYIIFESLSCKSSP